MTLPLPTILVYFGLEYASGDDHATYDDPVKGVYDDPTYLYVDAAGDGIDITTDAFYISIRRGRNRELDEFETGDARIVLHNFDRTYDGLNAAGIYFGDLVPGKRIEVSVYGQAIFTGTVEDWDLEWPVEGGATAEIYAVDALGQLARKEFDAWTTTAAQDFGERMEDVLNRPEVAFGANRAIGVCASQLQSDNVTWGSNVLNYGQLARQSEQGWLYADRYNILTVRGRHDLVGDESTVSFADDGSGVPFHGIKTQTGSEVLHNRVGVDREGGTLQTVEDAASQAAYGVRSLNLPGLLIDSDSQSESMAQFLLSRYKEPRVRIESLSVKIHGLVAEAGMVVSRDMGDIIDITWTPEQVGDPVEATLAVEGVKHEITVDEHLMTMATAPLSQVAVAVYDDPVWGVYNGPGLYTF